MDKVFELLGEAANNKISKLKLKSTLKKYVQGLDKALEFLNSVDQDKFLESLHDNISKATIEAGDSGKITAETVEAARRIMVMNPNEISREMYKTHKNMFEYYQEVKNNRHAGGGE